MRIMIVLMRLMKPINMLTNAFLRVLGLNLEGSLGTEVRWEEKIVKSLWLSLPIGQI